MQAAPLLAAEKQESLFNQAFEGQIAAMEKEVLAKSHELESAKGRLAELEQALTKKEANLSEQTRMVKRAEEESRESVAVVEEANAALKELIAQQGAEIMRLQDQLSQAARPVRVTSMATSGGGGGSRGSSGSLQHLGRHGDLRMQQGSSGRVAGGIDIGRVGEEGRGIAFGTSVSQGSLARGAEDRYACAHPELLIDKSTNMIPRRSFVVGSPPQSSDGASFGGGASSENGSSVPCRGTRSHGATRSPLMASPATEAVESPLEGAGEGGIAGGGTSSSTSSVNGRH